MNDPKLYYIFIRERIERIEEFCGQDVEAALEDPKTLLAIERLLETLSDATKFVPADVKSRYQHIEWSKITGFRNVLAHGYLGISTAAISDVLQTGIPELKKAMEDIIKNHA